MSRVLRVVLRVCAGVLAVGFVWLAVAGEMPARQRVLTGGLAAVFTVYAAVGVGGADRVLGVVLGTRRGEGGR